MEDFRSKSTADGRMQIDNYYGSRTTAGHSSYGINGMQDLRCYSASYASSLPPIPNQLAQNNDVKFKKGKSTNGSSTRNWSFNDPELQRKKRVASYKVYTVEGKVKGSLKKSFRWIKDKYTRMVYGWSYVNNLDEGAFSVTQPDEVIANPGRSFLVTVTNSCAGGDVVF